VRIELGTWVWTLTPSRACAFASSMPHTESCTVDVIDRHLSRHLSKLFRMSRSGIVIAMSYWDYARASNRVRRGGDSPQFTCAFLHDRLRLSALLPHQTRISPLLYPITDHRACYIQFSSLMLGSSSRSPLKTCASACGFYPRSAPSLQRYPNCFLHTAMGFKRCKVTISISFL